MSKVFQWIWKNWTLPNLYFIPAIFLVWNDLLRFSNYAQDSWRSRFWHKHPLCPWMSYLVLSTFSFLICRRALPCFPRYCEERHTEQRSCVQAPLQWASHQEATITVSKQIRLAEITAGAARSLQAVHYLHCRKLYVVRVQYKWSVAQSAKPQVAFS